MFTIKASVGDLIIGLALVAIAAYVMAVAWQMPQGRAAVPGPGFFPFWAGGILAAIGLAISVRGIRMTRDPGAVNAEGAEVTLGSGNIFFAVAALIGCAVLFERVGFMLSASLFLFAMIWRLSALGALKSLAVAFVVALAADLFFRTFLGLYLPPNPQLLSLFR